VDATEEYLLWFAAQPVEVQEAILAKLQEGSRIEAEALIGRLRP
jgi:uncharacterized protein (DUF3820 family)